MTEQTRSKPEESQLFTEFYDLFREIHNKISDKIELEDDRLRLYHAIAVAIKTHEGQTRRVSGLPYIIHPLEVLSEALDVTNDIDTLIASILHDGSEDAPKKFVAVIKNNAEYRKIIAEENSPPADKKDDLINAYQSLEEEFGADAANIVRGVTKDPTETDWSKRAMLYIQTIEFEAPDESSILCSIDKICNLRNRLREYRLAKNEKDVSDHFHSVIDDQLWWFTANLDMLRRKSEQPGFKYKVKLKTLINELETLVVEFRQLVDNLDTVYGVVSFAGAVACSTEN